MKTIKFLDMLDQLGTRVFTFNEACRVLGGSRDYCKTFLYRTMARGAIFPVEKGKYHLKHADEFEIASNVVHPSYVSFLSALQFHGKTMQIPVTLQVACLRQKKPVNAAGYTITFISIARDKFFGFARHENAFIADPEKAIIDGLYLPRHLPIDDARSAIDAGVSTSLLVEYTTRFASPVVAKRVGYLLDAAGIDVYPALKSLIGAKYDLLDPLLPPAGRRDPKWYLVLNGVVA
nr:hypothetical protein [Candidatus Sigynarchaeota archaeon]